MLFEYLMELYQEENFGRLSHAEIGKKKQIFNK